MLPAVSTGAAASWTVAAFEVSEEPRAGVGRKVGNVAPVLWVTAWKGGLGGWFFVAFVHVFSSVLARFRNRCSDTF